MKLVIKNEFKEHLETSKRSMDLIIEQIESAAKICIDGLENNGKIILFGNGGSAADSQHIAA